MDRKKPQAEVFFYILCLQLKTACFIVSHTLTKHGGKMRNMSNETRELLEWLLKNTYDETIREEIKKELKEG